MIELVYDNKVIFDSFLLEALTPEEDITETSEKINLNKDKYWGASAYICKDCIEKYNLLMEAKIEHISEIEDGYSDIISYACCVKGCSNMQATDVWMNIDKCETV
jgi:hypothetical protein